MKWCRLVTARYGHRGVRLGEARNPGPPKRLRRVPNRRPGSTGPHSANRFEILSSDDDEPLVPPTVPGSSRANRDSFQLSSVSPTVPASSSAVHRALEGAEQAIQARIESRDTPAVDRGAPLPATERDPDTEEIPRHVIGTPRDSESEDTVSVGRVSWDGVVGGEEAIARAIPFEIDDGRSDVGSAASEDREADAPSEEEPEVREVVITPAVRAGLAWLTR